MSAIERPKLGLPSAPVVVDLPPVEAVEGEPTPVAASTEPKSAPPAAPFPLLREQRVRWNARASTTAIRVLQKSAKTEDVFRGLRLSTLADGDPFDARLAAALEKICGTAITKSALTELYESCLPNTRARISASATADKNIFEFTVTWIDNACEPISTLRRKLKRHDDGSLELYSHGCWVDPEHRGKAVSSRVMSQEVTLLRTLSDHPKTRLSLWAGGVANPKKRSEQQSVGIYAWANFGFELASEHGLKTNLGLNTERARCAGEEGEMKAWSDLTLLKHQFRVFLDRLVAAGEDPELMDAIAGAVERVKKPWELANLRIEGLRFEVPIGGAKVPCDLGKAFLLSKDAPRWEGVFFVNDRESAGAKLAAGYIARAIAAAESSRTTHEASLLRELAAADPDARAQAIERIGVECGEEWIARLSALAGEHTEHAEAIELAMQRLRHEWEPPRPKIEYATYSYTYSPSTFELPREYKELDTLETPALLERVRGGDFRLAEAALQVLAQKSKDTEPELVRAEAKALFLRASDDERWTQRRTAVDVLGRVPNEAGIAELIELWPREDDINVLVAIQRWLDGAETPIAEAPAHELGVRIDALKEEIRVALEDLMGESTVDSRQSTALIP